MQELLSLVLTPWVGGAALAAAAGLWAWRRGRLHRQGFGGIDDIEECTLEPGGVFCMKPKKPSEDEARHAQLMSRRHVVTLKVLRNHCYHMIACSIGSRKMS